MAHVCLYVRLFNTVSSHFRLFVEIWYIQTVLFACKPTDLLCADDPFSLLNFPECVMIFYRVQRVFWLEVDRIEQFEVLPPIWHTDYPSRCDSIVSLCWWRAADICHHTSVSNNRSRLWFSHISALGISYPRLECHEMGTFRERAHSGQLAVGIAYPCREQAWLHGEVLLSLQPLDLMVGPERRCDDEVRCLVA